MVEDRGPGLGDMSFLGIARGQRAGSAAQIAGQGIIWVTLVGYGLADCLADQVGHVCKRGPGINLQTQAQGADGHAHCIMQFPGMPVGCGRTQNKVHPAQGAGEDDAHGGQDHAEWGYLLPNAELKQ